MSICFKADYHPDDNRTILFCGNTDVTTGTLTSGISIDAHDIYINNRSVAKLTDESINSVDITCQKVTAKDIDDKGEEITYDIFIIKVYVDGVLTAVTKETSFPSLSDKVYFGGRIAGDKSTYLCDCNIYNFQLYDTALTDFDIMINYINNKVSTSYINNQPNFSIITEELKTNFCERASDGSVTSYMFKNGEYTIDFLLDGSSHLDITKLGNYAKVLGIPIMLIDVSTDANWTFDAFVTQQTAGNVSLPKTSGRTIQYWDPNGANTSIINITNASVELQGTSTLSDSVKNLNITVPEDTVFIPKDTWFPEQTYTLKADVVDSSHSNNAAIGGFINEKLGYDEQTGAFFPFDKNAINNVYTADYKKKQQPTVTLKHTVEGFPVFLIMKFNTNTSSTISVTPLGIYSFNIGRDAYRNLGFKKVNSISDSVGDVPEIKTFPYLLERARINETDSDANWIEIKDTTSVKDLIEVTNVLPENFDCSKGDFWQDDPSILDARYEVRFGNKTVPSQYENFKTFVKNIMSLPIEGCSTTDVLGNRDQSQITGSYDKYQVDNKSNYTKTGLKNEFVTDSNSLPADLGFNADSFYKYFVIGLLFGLIDNFGKNSTYRSWLGGQYFIDFYDLDCGLRGDNQGDLSVTPDLWIKYLYNYIQEGKNYGYVCESFNLDKTYIGEGSNRRQTGSKTVVSANHNKLWLSLDTPFFRGYSGDTSNSVYTKYWYQLREKMDELASAAGYDNFADYFIDEFYIKQTKSCGPLLFNYDYKLKYLLQFRGNEYNTTKDLSKLHGRKIAVARDWLKKHISFMDSLFYWRDNGQTLNFKNDLDSRGSNTVLNTPESLPMTSNTPLLVYNSVGDSAKTFYFMQTNMKTYVNTAGNSSNSPLTWNFSNSPNIIEFGDSETPLSSMNIKILSSTPNSRNLNSIGYPSITSLLLGNNKSFASSFNLESFSKAKVSELRTIDLSNTSGESFTLNLVNTASDGSTYTKFSKLTSINIGNSSCISNITIPTIPLNELVLVNSSITNFNLANQKYITGVDLTGCSKLRTIEINKCDSYKELRVSNLANLETVKIVSCDDISSIIIINCSRLRTVNIEYCDKLTTIQINNCKSLVGGTSDNYIRVANCNNINSLDLSNNLNLKKVSIDGCDRVKIETLKIHQTNITDVSSSTNLSGNMKLDLTEFSQLKTFTCYYNKSVKYIAFANNQNAPIPITSTFQECPNLERIYGCVELSNASYSGNYGLFRGCSKFSVHGITTTRWKGKSIKKGAVWCTPWELLRANPSEYNTVTWAETFTTGSTATNIRFADKSSQLESLFRGTAIDAFNPRSGQGTMDLRKIFTAGSQCISIVNSFCVSLNTTVANILGKVKFPIANDTFINLKNLVLVGYDSAKGGGGSETQTSFMGSGLDKYIEGSTFPINIVSSLPNLEVFSGFFRGVRGDLSSPPAIPGKMFEKNTKLRDVSSLMYNASIQFTLSGDGFKNCPNLTNVAYFCYHDVTSEISNRSKLTGSIPYHMFYHGTSGNENKVFKGTNQVTKPDETFDMQNLLSETLTFPVMRRNITNMTRCFYGCIGLESYSMDTQDVESNPNYSPFKWMYNEQNNSWYEGTDNKKVDASWSYDGASTQVSDYKYLDTGAIRVTTNVLDKVETLHYMCPPDLFRYCANLNSTKIQGVFENCGLNYSVNTSGWINTNEGYYSTGITGRIPPYLLRPLSSITDISYMFKNCKRLSSYMKDSLIYQIPKDFFSYAPKITSLVETFQGLAFIPSTNLTVFGALTNALDIRCIMQSCIWGKNDVTWNISGIFGINTIARISGAFSMKDLYIDSNKILGVSASEYGTMSIPNSTTMGSNFGTNSTKIPAPTATGYVYYLWEDKANDSLINNENSNYNS
nr:MAG TPA: Serine/threonine-protein kinase BRI1-like 1 [Crassvirales sp.]